MLPFSAILFAFLIFLPGCSSSLGVQVDIFDLKGVTADDTLQATMKREAAKHAHLSRTNHYSNVSADLQSQVKAHIQFLSDEIAIMTEKQARKNEADASTKVKEKITSAQQTRDAALQDLRTAESTEKPADKRNLLMSASHQFETANRVLNDLRSDILKIYGGPLQVYLKSIDSERKFDSTKFDRIVAMTNASESASEKNLQSLTGGLDLLDDPLAPVIIGAAPQYWKGIFNKTDAFGTVGNTDIAIKMETIGTFTIKGIRLDASKVTEATFDVLKQSVRMVAAAYGIPTPADQTSANSGDTGSPTNIVLSIDQVRQASERKRLLSRRAALTILDLIVTQKDNLTNDGKRKAAIQQLKMFFEAYKTQLIGI